MIKFRSLIEHVLLCYVAVDISQRNVISCWKVGWDIWTVSGNWLVVQIDLPWCTEGSEGTGESWGRTAAEIAANWANTASKRCKSIWGILRRQISGWGSIHVAAIQTIKSLLFYSRPQWRSVAFLIFIEVRNEAVVPKMTLKHETCFSLDALIGVMTGASKFFGRPETLC